MKKPKDIPLTKAMVATQLRILSKKIRKLAEGCSARDEDGYGAMYWEMGRFSARMQDWSNEIWKDIRNDNRNG